MSERVYAFTVILEGTIREPDIESVLNALAMVKGVADVKPLVSDAQLYFACEKARRELGEKIMGVIYPEAGE